MAQFDQRNVLNMNFVFIFSLSPSKNPQLKSPWYVSFSPLLMVLWIVYICSIKSFSPLLSTSSFYCLHHWPPGTILMGTTKYYYIKADQLFEISRCRLILCRIFLWYVHFFLSWWLDNGTSFQVQLIIGKFWDRSKWAQQRVAMGKCWYDCV